MSRGAALYSINGPGTNTDDCRAFTHCSAGTGSARGIAEVGLLRISTFIKPNNRLSVNIDRYRYTYKANKRIFYNLLSYAFYLSVFRIWRVNLSNNTNVNHEAGWRIHASVNWAFIGSYNGLSSVRRHAIIWTINGGLRPLRPLETNLRENWVKIRKLLCGKRRFKMSSAKWRTFCLSLGLIRCDGGCRLRSGNESVHHATVGEMRSKRWWRLSWLRSWSHQDMCASPRPHQVDMPWRQQSTRRPPFGMNDRTASV